jgi:DNA-directed RNA polymerase specialized sigma24 family protein
VEEGVTRGARKKQRLALGLAVSALSMKPGQTRSSGELAAFCDCSKGTIQHIEKKALRKLRRRLQPFLRAA